MSQRCSTHGCSGSHKEHGNSSCSCGSEGCGCGCGCGCGSSSQKCSCCEHCKCGCQDKQGCHEEKFAHHLIKMADDAWMESLYDKIKEHVQAHCGAQLDELAKMAAERNSARWKHKVAAQNEIDEFHDKVDDFFKKDKK